MTAITKKDITEKVYTSLPPYYKRLIAQQGKKIVENIIDRTIEEIKQAALEGKEVQIINFGRIFTTVRKPQLVHLGFGNDPKYVAGKAKIKVVFRASNHWTKHKKREIEQKYLLETLKKEREAQEKTKILRKKHGLE